MSGETFCIFTHTIYGYSGNELMPRQVKSHQFVEFPHPGESDGDFKERMQGYGMIARRALSTKTVRPYSIRDGLDWMIYPGLKPLNLETIMEPNNV